MSSAANIRHGDDALLEGVRRAVAVEGRRIGRALSPFETALLARAVRAERKRLSMRGARR